MSRGTSDRAQRAEEDTVRLSVHRPSSSFFCFPVEVEVEVFEVFFFDVVKKKAENPFGKLAEKKVTNVDFFFFFFYSTLFMIAVIVCVDEWMSGCTVSEALKPQAIPTSYGQLDSGARPTKTQADTSRHKQTQAGPGRSQS
ncbi:uncharacterized protein MCYG_08721 [Microsporum canis CBS 113480]|uniref:Uncharacterized protein n=1 Tax=Arthroderma otae (strain ATCC MYA-4605 / CBS 113480) TaxID=554155 RepID=C5G199_ARTOC|nr:uncharacterized protein MCYG_08721 [Microsporum canis CBS 113480]EEQ28562.1 predicted protein [Microsporum canis CBS 113480]